jgi:hypothetical protein
MDGDTLFTIGELARRTGLRVKTIRFSSDTGIVAPAERSPAGYRLYGIGALVRPVASTPRCRSGTGRRGGRGRRGGPVAG